MDVDIAPRGRLEDCGDFFSDHLAIGVNDV